MRLPILIVVFIVHKHSLSQDKGRNHSLSKGYLATRDLATSCVHYEKGSIVHVTKWCNQFTCIILFVPQPQYSIIKRFSGCMYTFVALTLLCSNLLFTCTDSQYYYCPFPKSVLSMHCTNSKLLHAWLINHKHKDNYSKIQAFQLTKIIASWILSYLTSDIWIFCKTSIIIIRISYQSTVCLLAMLESGLGGVPSCAKARSSANIRAKDATVNCSKDFITYLFPALNRREIGQVQSCSVPQTVKSVSPFWHLYDTSGAYS